MNWIKLTEIKSAKKTNAANYTYTDALKDECKFYRYAIVGRSGARCSIPAFECGWGRLSICIDPGHYIGGNSNGVYSEGTQMLILGNYLKSALENYTIEGSSFADTRITRIGNGKTEYFVNGVNDERNYIYGSQGWINALMSRGYYSKDCDFFISLHSNAMSHWNETNLWSVNVYPNHTTLNSIDEWNLAYELGLTASNTIAPNGIPVNSRYRFSSSSVNDWSDGSVTHFKVLRGADTYSVPGILLEHSFHTNPAVRGWLGVSSNLQALGGAEAKTFLTHYGFPIA